MRVGQNPAKSIDTVHSPEKVTVALVTYIPFLKGYYAESLDVLRLCLNSICENTDTPYDLLVFDNASCIEVRDLLLNAQKQDRLQYLVLSEKNVGKGGAWNFIFQAAPGEIIAYADSDVYFRPGWLSNSLDVLEKYPDTGMVTARPMRTPQEFYTSTLKWAKESSDVIEEKGKFISWKVYREHIQSLGTSQEKARKWYESRVDTRLTYRGVNAYVGAAHFQFTAYKSVLQKFVPFIMDRPMGQVRSLDEQLNKAGYLRLSTCNPYVKHIGNRLDEDKERLFNQRKTRKGVSLFELSFIKRALLWIYNAIFKLYNK